MRESARALVQNVPSPELISGDGERAVALAAKAVGIEKYSFEKSPLEKCERILQLKKDRKVVAFVGDGVNDAPALAAAFIGISMASAPELAIHVSDIALTTDDIGVIETIRRAAVRGRKRIYENLFWAFFYNIVGVGLALFGYLTPIYAAAADGLREPGAGAVGRHGFAAVAADGPGENFAGAVIDYERCTIVHAFFA